MKSNTLLSVLKASEAIIENENSFCNLNSELGFNRIIHFKIRGVSYSIVWFENLLTLNIGEVEVKFTSVEFSGTFPNKFKMNLQFKHGKDCVCIIPVKEY